MQNIQSKLRGFLAKLGKSSKALCRKNTAWVGLAVITVIVAADSFLYVDVKKNETEKEVNFVTEATDAEVQTETQTEDIVEDEIAEIESDEIYLVMGTIINQTASAVVVEEETTEEQITEEQTTEAETTVQPVIAYTEEDYNNLLRIVEAEATACDVLGKMMVANVIINRVKNPRFPNTLTGVIYHGNGEQFTPVKDGRFNSVTITQSTIEAVNRALAGEDYSQGALFFVSVKSAKPDCWHVTTLKRLFEYDGHIFFKY